MEVNLSYLSSFSKYFDKQKKLKKINPKLPDNYIGPFAKKKSIESYCYLTKEGLKEESIKSQKHEKFLISQFIKKLSRTNKQIEKERRDYINSLKYYNGENEKIIKLKKLDRIKKIAKNKELNNLLDLRKYKVKFDYKKRELNKQNNNIFNINNKNKDEEKIFIKKINLKKIPLK